MRHFRQDKSSSNNKRAGREHVKHGAATSGGAEDKKEDRPFSKTLDRAVTNFWIVMGESGGRAGEPTEPRGVGGIKTITGGISSGMSRSEEDDPVVLGFVRQLTVSSRALVGWKPHFSGSSAPEIHVLGNCVSNLLVVLVQIVRSRACVLGIPDDSLTSVRAPVEFLQKAV